MMKKQTWKAFNNDVEGIADEDKKTEIQHLIYEIENDCLDIFEHYPLLNDALKEEFYLEACKEYFIQAKLERR